MIDTEAKRRSVLAAGLAALVVLPLADGTVGTQDRPHVVGIYSGLVIDAPATAEDFIEITSLAIRSPGIASVVVRSPGIGTVGIRSPGISTVDIT